MIQSSVAVLEKGDGHSLRTAPWLESSGTLCIRDYHLDGVLTVVDFNGIVWIVMQLPVAVPQIHGDRTRLAGSDHLSVDSGDRHDAAGGAADEHLIAAVSQGYREVGFLDLDTDSARKHHHGLPGNAFQNTPMGGDESPTHDRKDIEARIDQIRKQMDTENLRDLLLENLEHPRWDEVAERCLSCTNCTMVCPTCFCSSVSEVSDLTTQEVHRVRQWDSCFNIDFSYTAGGTVRHDVRSRYRQWLTHKLAWWHDHDRSLTRLSQPTKRDLH